METRDTLLVLAEARGQKIHQTTFELLAWSQKLAGQRSLTLACAVPWAGPAATASAELTELIYCGADRVLAVEMPGPPPYPVNLLAGRLVQLIGEEKPTIVIAAATTSGRTLLPIAAARLGAGLTADCTELAIDPADGLLLQTRPAIGGNVLATIKTPAAKPQMATVRPRAIKPARRDPGRRGEIIFKTFNFSPESAAEKILNFVRREDEKTSLEDAEIVVVGGKGMESKTDFLLLEELAALLGAGLGATRDAVEAGWAPFERQVGLTGKTVSPKVYIGAGVSGKIQHLAGMITSGCIIAINNDPAAQLFQVADLGIIGDAPAVVTRLIAALKKRKLQTGSGDRKEGQK